jgi:asparagine synthetase B (glutamine-hydrolysing)
MIESFINIFYFKHVDKISNTKTIYGFRDRLGVRPMFYSVDDKSICFSSEMKGMLNRSNINSFLPGHYCVFDNKIKLNSNSYVFGLNSCSAILNNGQRLTSKEFDIFDFYNNNNFIKDWLSI